MKNESNTCIECSTTGSCPFAFSDESEKVQNYGCIPTRGEIISMKIDFDKSWACHDNPSKPCLGALKALSYSNVDNKVNSLISIDDDWSLFINEEKIQERYKTRKLNSYD